ncbi:MAG TPA: cytochrome c peroxidase [Ferruginibacter sp.]|jgi:cytochrome c peroxidase|nr:cytochrome c peroxidase [Ferruginibacter sp.]HRO95486.1 cytochrome c peroxidase [Ferruginibacter sp.]HRP49928.1 cytochrome c peroxidase [Ferruginibacter sp.]
MMKINARILYLGAICMVILSGAGLIKPTPRPLPVPEGWPAPNKNMFSKNPLTEEGFQLGRKLFHDGNLSKDGYVSCASCHQQFAGFSTFDHDVSHGVNNTFTTRNAPTLANMAWHSAFHWDGGVNHIEVQAVSPITAHNEMGETLENVIAKLKADETYPPLFKAAFGNETINSQRLLKALAQYTGSLVSANSKYDKVKRGEAVFSNIEQKGYEIFKAHCATCHREPLFTDLSYRNNGLPLNRFNDVGRMAITGKKEDSLKFKVPTLRNIQVSYPYMHDGSIFSIPQVIDHYTGGIQKDQSTLDPALKKDIAISQRQKYELMYFLFTLTDSTFLKNPAYGMP